MYWQRWIDYYRLHNANIHRGVHTLAEEATALYEDARAKIAQFIQAKKSREVIYTRSTTESINLVAQTWGRKNPESRRSRHSYRNGTSFQSCSLADAGN